MASQSSVPGSGKEHIHGGAARPGLDEDSGAPQPGDLERIARRGGAEVLKSIEMLPDAQADPAYLAAEVSRSNFGRTSKKAQSQKERRSLPKVWWRRPILVLGSCAAPSFAAQQATKLARARQRLQQTSSSST